MKKCAEKGSVGGRKQKISDDQIENAIKVAALNKKSIPSRAEVVEAIKKEYDISIDAKTISRRYPDLKKKEIAESVLGTK